MPSSKYTAERLAPIVASSSSLSDVMRKLGLKPTGGNHRMIQAYVRLAGLDTSHFIWRRVRIRIDALPRHQLVAVVRDSFSVEHAIRGPRTRA